MRIEVKLCLGCMIFVAEEVTRMMENQGGAILPFNTAIENVKASFERGRKTGK